MPAGLGVGGGGVAFDDPGPADDPGAVDDPGAADDPGAVVVVVVGVGVVVVVDELGAGAVVVVVVVDEGTVVGCVVVVVVVLVVVVVVVLLVVVVVGEEGAVVVVVVVVVGEEDPLVVVVVVGVAAGAGAGAVAGPGVVLACGTVIVAPVHAPAVCMVATSATMRIKARFSAAVSALSLETACWSALAALSRRVSAARSAPSARSVRAKTSDAATLSYCWATTPVAVGGPKGTWPDAGVRYEVLTYRPLLTYSPTAKLRSARCEAANLDRMEEVADWAAPSCRFLTTTSLLSVATPSVASCQLCRSDCTFP